MLPLLLALPLPQRAAPAEALPHHPRRLLVQVDPALERVPLAALRADLGLVELWNLPQIGWRAIEVPEGRLEAVRAALAADARVRSVTLDARSELAHVPNDPYWGGMWHMPQIRAELAWDTEQGDPSVVVAVMDTGIEVTHPDLAANVWINPGEIAGNLLDDDGNGYVDDVHGYDFAYVDSDPSDVNGHGTACAGLVAALQDNALGVTGVAPHSRVAAVKAALDTGYFYASANVPAFVYCAEMGFDVVSCSFYSDEVVPAERDAVRYCAANDVLVVVAAGNENSVHPLYPAAYPQVLSVGATIDAADNRAYFSNWGTWVDVAAPGWSLSTTVPGAGYITWFAGTSGAAPHVAGVAALLRAANPLATAAAVRAAIEDTSALLDQPPYGKWTRYGRVDADAALERILGLSSGSVPARLLFAAPCGGERPRIARADLGPGRNRDGVALLVQGVGLEAPNALEVQSGGLPLALLAQERNELRVALPGTPAPAMEVRRNGTPFGSWTWEPGPGLLYAATDACTEDTAGGQASGGWLELYRADGALFTCTEDTSGLITAEFAVRGVTLRDLRRLTLELERDYDGLNPGAIETIELYDWSSFSYPYGAWVTLSTTPAPTAGFAALTVDVPGDPDAYRDEEGTFYLRLTTTNAGAAGLLKADLLRLRAR
ncbi:MAG TPA: S8 family peptidase [Planctomycetota bacterium]